MPASRSGRGPREWMLAGVKKPALLITCLQRSIGRRSLWLGMVVLLALQLLCTLTHVPAAFRSTDSSRFVPMAHLSS